MHHRKFVAMIQDKKPTVFGQDLSSVDKGSGDQIVQC